PDDENQSLLVHVKNNISRPAPPLAFRITPLPDDPDRARLEWEPAPEGVFADAVLSPGTQSAEERENGQDADAFLTDYLADGERPAKEAMRAARDVGISESTLRRAKRRLGVIARKVGPPSKGAWQWSLPASQGAKAVIHESVTALAPGSGEIADTSS